MRESIILPTYNERVNIGALIREILEKVNPAEVIVVDDDSPDRTWEVVRDFGDPRVRLIRRINERGLTSAINEGISASKGDAVVWMDCDFSMPPAVIPELLGAVEEYDIAIGSRYIGNAKDDRDSLRERIGSWMINRLARFLLDSSINDYTSGFIAARKNVFKSGSGSETDLRGDYGEYCIDFLYRAKRKGFTIKEIPYICVTRRHGESKTATSLFKYIKRGMSYISTILKLRFSRS
ncbi:MAG: polyprenol monophosphomannose synthase [Nitrospirota bacterium]